MLAGCNYGPDQYPEVFRDIPNLEENKGDDANGFAVR